MGLLDCVSGTTIESIKQALELRATYREIRGKDMAVIDGIIRLNGRLYVLTVYRDTVRIHEPYTKNTAVLEYKNGPAMFSLIHTIG